MCRSIGAFLYALANFGRCYWRIGLGAYTYFEYGWHGGALRYQCCLLWVDLCLSWVAAFLECCRSNSLPSDSTDLSPGRNFCRGAVAILYSQHGTRSVVTRYLPQVYLDYVDDNIFVGNRRCGWDPAVRPSSFLLQHTFKRPVRMDNMMESH